MNQSQKMKCHFLFLDSRIVGFTVMFCLYEESISTVFLFRF